MSWLLFRNPAPCSFHSLQVLVFSKSYCPYCRRTKALFQQMADELPDLDIVVNVVEMDLLPGDDGARLQKALLERTGQRTVPNVFVAGQHVGGNDDTHALAASGKLQEMLTTISSSREL